MRRWFVIERCFEAIESYAAAHDVEYEYVVRMRTDMPIKARNVLEAGFDSNALVVFEKEIHSHLYATREIRVRDAQRPIHLAFPLLERRRRRRNGYSVEA